MEDTEIKTTWYNYDEIPYEKYLQYLALIYRDPSNSDPETIENLKYIRKDFIVLSERGGKILGGCYIYTMERGTSLYIAGLFVISEERYNKVGTNIINLCKQKMEEYSFYEIVLDSTKSAIEFYKKLGFTKGYERETTVQMSLKNKKKSDDDYSKPTSINYLRHLETKKEYIFKIYILKIYILYSDFNGKKDGSIEYLNRKYNINIDIEDDKESSTRILFIMNNKEGGNNLITCCNYLKTKYGEEESYWGDPVFVTEMKTVIYKIDRAFNIPANLDKINKYLKEFYEICIRRVFEEVLQATKFSKECEYNTSTKKGAIINDGLKRNKKITIKRSRKKSLRTKSLRKKSPRTKSLRKKSPRKKSLRKKSPRNV